MAVVSIAAIAGAISVRAHYDSVYKRTQKAYKISQDLAAEQQRAQAESRANEQRLIDLKAKAAQDPKSVRVRWALAAELQKYQMYNDALPVLQEIARLDPKSEDAAVAVANTELALGKLKEAAESYRKATVSWPKNVEAWQGLAAARFELRRYRDAGLAAQTALALAPQDKGTRIITAASALEFALEVPDENQTRTPLHIARALYEVMAKEDPEDGQTQYHLGLAKFLMHDKQGALPHLAKAAAAFPDRANIASDYAQILVSTGKYTEARAFLSQAIAKMPKVAAFHYLLGESYQFDSDPKSVQAAIDACKKAVELSPNTATYWDRLGAQYLKAKDITNARAAFEKSLVLNPNRSYPYQQLAGVYTRMGDAKRASVAAKMATRMTANDETMRHIEALSAQYPGDINLLLIRADRYRDLKMYGPARDLYTQALQLEPSNRTANAAIAQIDSIHSAGSSTK
jgi:tetratricopeptide (TPR) repeat protein